MDLIRFLVLLVAVSICTAVRAANPSFSDFDTTQFAVPGNKVHIKSGASVTNLAVVGTLTLNGSSITNDNWTASGTTNSSLAGTAFANGLQITNVGASKLVRTDTTGKLQAVTVGSNLTFDGTTLSGSASSDNWAASGTTNSTLPGTAFLDSLQVTNTTTLNGPIKTGLKVISGSDVDWSTGSDFIKLLSANLVVTFSNVSSNEAIDLTIVQDASHTVTWPSDIVWIPGSAPTMDTGAGVTNVFRFKRNDTVTTGMVAQKDDPTLVALAGLNSTAGYVVQTNTDAFTKRTITADVGISIANGDGVSGNTVITNTGVLSVTGAADISASTTSGAVTVGRSLNSTNDYVLFPSQYPLNGNSSAAALAASNTVYVSRIYINKKILIDKVVNHIGTTSATSHFGIGIYSSDGTTKLLDTGPVSTASGGAIVTTLSPGVTLTPDLYKIAWTCDSVTPTFRILIPDGTTLNTILNAAVVHYGTAATNSVAGQLPAGLGTISAGNPSAMIILFQN